MSESHFPVITEHPTAGSSGGGGNNILEHQQKKSIFKIGERVMAFDEHGRTVYGTVRWISAKIIGIETVSTLMYVYGSV